jgi:hypothetical protein
VVVERSSRAGRTGEDITASVLLMLAVRHRAVCQLAYPTQSGELLPVIGLHPLRERVENGRLILDTPTALPEGTAIDLVADDAGDDSRTTSAARCTKPLTASWKSADAGRLKPASAILDELRRRQ